MPGRDQRWRRPQNAAWAAAVAALLLAGCGEKPEPDLADLPPAPPATTVTAPATTTTGQQTTSTTTTRAPHGPRPIDAIRPYFVGLSLGKAGTVCHVLAPGAIDEIKLPKPGRDCATALGRSIGYHDPKGPLAFKSAHPRRMRIEQRGERAKVVATVVTRYVGERRPSIDDDIVYLKRSRAGWLILQPSAILYRAVGLEPPLSALKPPAGF